MSSKPELKLNRDTVRRLTNDKLAGVWGGVKKTQQEWDTIIDMAQCESADPAQNCETRECTLVEPTC